MLENTVEAPEYLLMYKEHVPHVPRPTVVTARKTAQNLEEIGPVRAFVVDVGHGTAAPPLPAPPLVSRLGKTLSVAGSGLPYMPGLRRTRRAATAH